jgi:hypothetical protein
VVAVEARLPLRQQQIRLLLVLVGRGKLAVEVAPPQLIQHQQQEQSLAELAGQVGLLAGPLLLQSLVQQLESRSAAVEVEDTSVLETSSRLQLLVLEQPHALAVRVV